MGAEVELQIKLPAGTQTVRAVVRHKNVYRHGFEFVRSLVGIFRSDAVPGDLNLARLLGAQLPSRTELDVGQVSLLVVFLREGVAGFSPSIGIYMVVTSAETRVPLAVIQPRKALNESAIYKFRTAPSDRIISCRLMVVFVQIQSLNSGDGRRSWFGWLRPWMAAFGVMPLSTSTNVPRAMPVLVRSCLIHHLKPNLAYTVSRRELI